MTTTIKSFDDDGTETSDSRDDWGREPSAYVADGYVI